MNFRSFPDRISVTLRGKQLFLRGFCKIKPMQTDPTFRHKIASTIGTTRTHFFPVYPYNDGLVSESVLVFQRADEMHLRRKTKDSCRPEKDCNWHEKHENTSKQYCNTCSGDPLIRGPSPVPHRLKKSIRGSQKSSYRQETTIGHHQFRHWCGHTTGR